MALIVEKVSVDPGWVMVKRGQVFRFDGDRRGILL
jgi:hypothetical protein